MKRDNLRIWLTAAASLLVGSGLLAVFLGLRNYPLEAEVPGSWQAVLYGALLMGFGVMVLGVGRIALRDDSHELKKALWQGVLVWLVFAAVISMAVGKWFGVVAAGVVAAMLGVPLLVKPKP